VAEEKEEQLEKKLVRYRGLTQEALAKVSIKAAKGSKARKNAEVFIKMARDYFSDAAYFEKLDMPLTALAAYSYAHAWLDAGIRAGFLDGKKDDRLFVLP
jgi:hypothetical protein